MSAPRNPDNPNPNDNGNDFDPAENTADFIPGFGHDSAYDDTYENHDRRIRSGNFLGRIASWSVARDFRKDLGHHTVGLVGDEKRLNHDGTPRTRTETNPLTGDEVKVSDYDMPVIPIKRHYHTQLHGKGHGEHKTRNHETQFSHPLYEGVLAGITEKGQFRRAVRATNEISAVAHRAADKHVGSLKQGVSNLLPENLRREGQLRRTYQDLMHGVYDQVMGVEDEFMPRPSGKEEESSNNTPENIPRYDEDWDAVLDLHNIQALRSFMVNYYLEREQGWDEPGNITIAAHSIIGAGGLHLISPAVLGAYLGVDARALDNQLRRGGEPVVPHTVMNKLNFFLQFAEDETQTDNEGNIILPSRLAAFNDDERISDAPIRRIDEAVAKREVFPGRAARPNADELAGFGPINTRPIADQSIPSPGVPNDVQREQELRHLIADPVNEDYFNPDWLRELDSEIKESMDKKARDHRRDTGKAMPPKMYAKTRAEVGEGIIRSHVGYVVSDKIVEAIDNVRGDIAQAQRRPQRRGRNNRN